MAGLVERLLAVESGAPDFIGDTDPHRCRTMWHRNPDGPEAATLIERAEAALSEAAAFVDDDTSVGSGWAMQRIEPVLNDLRAALAKVHHGGDNK